MLLEGFAPPAPPDAFAGKFASGDRVRVPVPGAQSIVGVVRRPHGGSPATHAVVAPEGGGAHVLAPVGDVRLDTPKQFAQARRRAIAQQQAMGPPQQLPGKPAVSGKPIVVKAPPPGAPRPPAPVAEGVCVLLEDFNPGELRGFHGKWIRGSSGHELRILHGSTELGSVKAGDRTQMMLGASKVIGDSRRTISSKDLGDLITRADHAAPGLVTTPGPARASMASQRRAQAALETSRRRSVDPSAPAAKPYKRPSDESLRQAEKYGLEFGAPPSHGGFKVGDHVSYSLPSRGPGGHGPVTFTKQPGVHTVVGLQRNGNLRLKHPVNGTTVDVNHLHVRREGVAAGASGGPRPWHNPADAARARRFLQMSEPTGIGVLVEGFALETPQQSQTRGAAQVATAQKQLAAGWTSAKHPRGAGGKFGYTTGGKRATRSSAATQRTLGVGSKGALVKSIQKQLGLPTDGVYGPQTRAAVERYQRQHGLQVDGVIGAQTLSALRGHVNASSIKPGPITSKIATVRVHKTKRVTSKSRKAQLAKQTNFGVAPTAGSQFGGGVVV